MEHRSSSLDPLPRSLILTRTTLPALRTTSRPSFSSAPVSNSPKRRYKQRPRPQLSKIEKAPQVCNEPNQATENSHKDKRKRLKAIPQHVTGIQSDEKTILLRPVSDDSRQRWISTAKVTLGKLLEIKHKLNQQKAESGDINTQSILSQTIARLQRELNCFPCQDSIREQCQQIVGKMATINREIQQSFQLLAAELKDVKLVSPKIPCIPDADFVVTGFDGKKMFFKKRASSCVSNASDESNQKKNATAMVVPHPPGFADDNTTSLHVFAPMPTQTSLRSGLAARRWPNARFIGVCRIDRVRTIVRIEMHQSLRILQIEAYCATGCRMSSVLFPVAFLAYSRSGSIHSQKRRSEADQSQQYTEKMEDYAKQILPCLIWKHDNKLDFQLPVRYRQARILSFRSYATFVALLTVRLGKDFSLEVRCVEAHTLKTQDLTLTSENISSTTGCDVATWLERRDSQPEFYETVCRKLFLEYTTRGFELLYPGLKPRGRPQRHPMELKMLQTQEEKLKEERQLLVSAMAACGRQAASRAIRKREQYTFR